jgi:mannose-6-phosphate isomerase-like protein (cupin superfamily)
MTAAGEIAEFIGGVGLTHLKVYDQRPAPDGRMSGCAHIHGLTDEGYYTIAGAGALELHDPEHGFRSVPLTPGNYVQFTPGTLHRTVSEGGLEVLVIMGNAGLAERGDARIYFGAAVDDDPAEYARLAALPREGGLKGALERRDASVAAYMALTGLFERDRAAYDAELARFLEVHRRDLAARRDQFGQVIETSLEHWLGVAHERIDGLAAAPGAAQGQATDQTRGGPKYGMCGILHQLHGLGSV